MLRLLTLLLSCASVCAQPVLSLNDPTVVAKSSSLLQGLVGYWQLEEASGTRYDRSPYGNHLTAVNSPTNTIGIQGNAATFNYNSSQYLNLPSNQSVSVGNSEFTITGWIYKLLPSRSMAVFCKGTVSYGGARAATNEYTVYLNSSRQPSFALGDGFTNYVVSTSAITTNSWTFICAWANRTENKIYIQINNGTPVSGASPAGYSNSALPLRISADVDGFYSGDSVDEVGFWKRILSVTERTQLYRSGLGVTYPRFSMRDNLADDFNWDTWEPLYDRPKPFPTLYAFVNRREPEPLLTICE